MCCLVASLPDIPLRQPESNGYCNQLLYWERRDPNGGLLHSTLAAF